MRHGLKIGLWASSVLTRDNIDDIDRGYSTEDSKDVGYVWEHNGDGACGDLEADRADNVELGRKLLLPSRHEVQRVSERNVIEDNVSDHARKYQDTGDRL